jgi:hypothetical protein
MHARAAVFEETFQHVSLEAEDSGWISRKGKAEAI